MARTGGTLQNGYVKSSWWKNRSGFVGEAALRNLSAIDEDLSCGGGRGVTLELASLNLKWWRKYKYFEIFRYGGESPKHDDMVMI